MSDTLTHELVITEAAKAELRKHIDAADVSDLEPGQKLRLKIGRAHV